MEWKEMEKDIPHTQYIHEIIPKSSLYNEYVRKLVNETHGVFLSLNTRAQTFQDGRKSTEILKISQQYRCIILACIEDLNSASESTRDEEHFELLQMFSDIELLWHLLQSLIIETHSGTRVLYKLLEWIKWHFLFAEPKMEQITQAEEPSLHPEYWDTIIQFLLQGKIISARSLMSLHPKFQREDFLSLDELLRNMPMYAPSTGISLNEFRMRWTLWHEECKARLQRGEFSSEVGLEEICKILCGDADMLTTKSYLCGNWYHLMISVLFYTDPCINISSLGDTARAYYNNVACNGWNKSNLVDSIILAAFEFDIMNVLNLACSINDGWWFAVHITDLLTHGDYIDLKMQLNSSQNYREFLIKNYADTLMSHSSLWQIGLDYLDHCQINARALQEIYLERIPLQTEAKARKILFLAKKRNMDNLVKTIANVMTSKAIANGKLETALTWVAHSKDVHFADELANRWLREYVERRNIEGFEILKDMGSCMLVSDKLTFVGKYCEFHKLYSENEYKLSASLLLSLISSGLAPPNFQMIMLLDALPLLEAPDLIFSSKETYQLMKCLEDCVLYKEQVTVSFYTFSISNLKRIFEHLILLQI
ncbi:nuclear pore complex protein Nup85-like isoform X2 [Stegodyphus dumicola]|uniref:nuclear pore complex protein Nup85-like isoform X2 n=1 Tax=Stegodyphus dumicola TaxID=202533 RepID=UPI0015AE5A9F|nr:nuclear pore complex protein Nup85-like isoform X2 [Stegodyphus dumicola]